MDAPKRPTFKDIAGQKFGRWTAIEFQRSTPSRQAVWLCRCECGQEASVQSGSLISRKSKSCGCIKREMLLKRNSTHGLRRHPLYPCWNNMVHRCTNPKAVEWHRYGARGIKVCDRWLVFKNFMEDMVECPPGCSLDRIDNSSGYSKENCRWATFDQQSNNKRSNVLITVGGRTQTRAQWSRETGLNQDALRRKPMSEIQELIQSRLK